MRKNTTSENKKSIIIKIRNKVSASRIDTDKERIRELEDKSEHITQDTAKKGKMFKRPGRKKKEMRERQYLKKMAKIFPGLRERSRVV